MTDFCMYFQVHQPIRMRRYSVFDIGINQEYFDHQKNKEVLRKVADKCYLPANKLLHSLIKKHDGRFKIAMSITGTTMEQCASFAPEVLTSFRKLVDTGCVELLAETYYHSLSSLFDPNEFKEQIDQHSDALWSHFGVRPKVFRNTELIYWNELAKRIEMMGFKGILAEGADHSLKGRNPNFIFSAKGTNGFPVLTKNYKLSDDIAFRFGNKSWEGYPMTAKKFVNWAHPMIGDSINLFMDYETFGEHQWVDTGIFDFLENLPEAAFSREMGFIQPTEVCKMPVGEELDVHLPTSWADMERDTSAWLGNRMQESSAKLLFSLREPILASNDPVLIDSWRKLTTSDHLYYMCTKWFNDGDVHKYFNPYDSPYDAYLAFTNILHDLSKHVNVDLGQPIVGSSVLGQ